MSCILRSSKHQQSRPWKLVPHCKERGYCFYQALAKSEEAFLYRWTVVMIQSPYSHCGQYNYHSTIIVTCYQIIGIAYHNLRHRHQCMPPHLNVMAIGADQSFLRAPYADGHSRQYTASATLMVTAGFMAKPITLWLLEFHMSLDITFTSSNIRTQSALCSMLRVKI